MNTTLQESDETIDFNTLSIIITSSLLFISEILPFIKIIKANGILDFIKITIYKLKRQKLQESELDKIDSPENENTNKTTTTEESTNYENFFNTIINKLDEISSRLNRRNCSIELVNDSSKKISIEFP
jgi:hypothetical protein